MVNNYYDDMAWLALATLRLEQLAEDTRKQPAGGATPRILQSLTLQFDSASTDDLGGGTFWSTKRDFKNTPATAPVALYYARTGNGSQGPGACWTGWMPGSTTRTRACTGTACGSSAPGRWCWKSAIYTYNQGPVLGALLELGGAANLGAGRRPGGRGGAQPHRSRPRCWAAAAAVLRCEGTGDGGLFTGILVRYLALAAVDERLPGRNPGHGRAARDGHRRGLLGGPPDRSGPGSARTTACAAPRRPPGLFRPTGTAGTPQLSAGRRRRTFHPAPGLDGAGGGSGHRREGAGYHGGRIRSRNSFVIDVILIT